MSETARQSRGFESSALAEAHFYEAFANIDSQSMSQVWVSSDSAYCIHPGGEPMLGYAAIQGSWQAMFKGGQPVRLFYQVVKKQVIGDLAVHLVEEEISSIDGGQRGLVMATNCYQRTDEGWRILSHHGSPMISMGRSQAEGSAQIH